MCLKYVKANKDKYPFFIMMDFDDVNCKNCNPEIIKKYFIFQEYKANFDEILLNN